MCPQGLETKLGCLDSAAGARSHLEAEEGEGGEEEVVVMVNMVEWHP